MSPRGLIIALTTIAAGMTVAVWCGRAEDKAAEDAPPAAKDCLAQSTAGSLDSLDNRLIRWGVAASSGGRVPAIPVAWRTLLASYGGICLGDTTSNQVFLTFDAGYESGYTSGILDVLKSEGVQAAFFVTGHYIDSEPALVARMAAEGHIVGNHTRSHASLPTLNAGRMRAEMDEVAAAFKRVTGKEMRYLRPPSGEVSERALAVARQAGYVTVMWSLAFKDWEPLPGGPEENYRTLVSRLHNGAVILLHVTSADNAKMLRRAIASIRERGYTFGNLDLLAASDSR